MGLHKPPPIDWDLGFYFICLVQETCRGNLIENFKTSTISSEDNLSCAIAGHPPLSAVLGGYFLWVPGFLAQVIAELVYI